MVAGKYYVILPPVDDEKKDVARVEIADLFSILRSTARKIIDSAPVVLLEDATEEEVKAIKSRFNGVSDLGLTLDIRTEKVPGIHAVQWGKKRPKIVSSNGEDVGAALEEAAGYVAGSETVAEAPPLAETPAEPSTEEAARTGRPLPDLFAEALEDEDDEYTYSVFLSNIGSASRKEKAMQQIMEIRGISHAESEELCGRTVIPVLKGVSKGQAELTLKRFAKLRIFGCITKRPKQQ